MPIFYLPCVDLRAAFDEPTIRHGRFAIHKRLWSTSTFDLATLATRHRLHIQYQLMDVLLAAAHCELEVGAKGPEEAKDAASVFKAMLYLRRVTPFLLPFVATHSVNAYSGINSRDSENLRGGLPKNLQEGASSDATTVEVWPNELSLFTIQWAAAQQTLSAMSVEYAASSTDRWLELEGRFASVKVARMALVVAPTIQSLDSSLLHIWQGIESLFPDVRAELKFRLSLLMAQLGEPEEVRAKTYASVKAAYDVRSKVVHGSSKGVRIADWVEAWHLLALALRAVLARNALPSEADLTNELLKRVDVPCS